MAKEESKTRIEILCSEGGRESGILKIPVTILCSKGDTPLSGESVNIFVNEVFHEGPSSVEEGGRVTTVIPVPSGAKSITIDAQLVGTTKHGRKTIQIVAEEKQQKKAAKIMTFDKGDKGDYMVTFQAEKADNTPMEGAVIRVFDLDHPQICFDLSPTNESGFTTHRFRFSARRKVVKIEIVGHPETARQLNLFF